MNVRGSGVLIHPTSLPSDYTIGDLGEGAYEFIDFLYRSKQKLWQILPITMPNNSYSPYLGISAFAGNYLLISPDKLAEEGFISEERLKESKGTGKLPKVDFDKARLVKDQLLEEAFESYNNMHDPCKVQEFSTFKEENKYWLNDFTAFMVFSERYHTLDWSKWPKDRSDDALRRAEYYAFVQYIFYKQWKELKNYANAKGIKIIGDIPIYLDKRSADVWAHQDLFVIDSKGRQSEVAGAPPDDFCSTGQRWGSCLYKWDKHEETGFDWWMHRLQFLHENVDIIRIDHFRGLDEYWAIPYDASSASCGEWKKGPGIKFFNTIKEKLGEIEIIVEDLGIITDSVINLKKETGYPGIKILQTYFNGDAKSGNLPHNYDSSNCVAYTSTHDTSTLYGWYTSLENEKREYLNQYLHEEKDPVWSCIRWVLSSIANMSIVQVQDLLQLTDDYRMNRPGVDLGNWSYRLQSGELEDGISDKLKELTILYNRD